MRFRITLRINAQQFGRRLPINYQYEMSAAIYKILSSADSGFATWLHQNGFQMDNGKQFKLFTFSRLQIPKNGFTIIKQSNQLELKSQTVDFQISFMPENSTQTFIGGVFENRTFEIGRKGAIVQFEVESIELIQPPEFKETMMYHTLSPISVSCHDEQGRDRYPQTPQEFKDAEWIRERMLQNLIDKFSAFYGKEYSGEKFLKYLTLSEPKSSLIAIKAGTPAETKVRGFMCQLALNAPSELQRIAYESGLGELNSQGFGCLGLM